MKWELPEIRPEERTPLVEALVGTIQQLLDRVGQLEATNQQWRDEIAQLKGQKSRPTIPPSALETTPDATAKPAGGKPPGSAKRPKTAELTIHHEIPLHRDQLAEGAALRGYEP